MKVKFLIYLLCCFDFCVFLFFLLLLFHVHLCALVMGNSVQDSCKNTRGIILDTHNHGVLALRVAELQSVFVP